LKAVGLGIAAELQLSACRPFLSFDLITPAGAHHARGLFGAGFLVLPRRKTRLHVNLASETSSVKQSDSHVVVKNTG
jgi:hypothetical protein